MRRVFFYAFMTLFAAIFLIHSAVPVLALPARIGTDAEAAALIDVSSGRFLYTQNGDKRMRIASLTKIMTALVAIEKGRLSDQVKVSPNAFGEEGSSIYLKLGEDMSLEHLLYGLMLRSGNDAAVAIAEHVGGSLDGFVVLMNEKARELGMLHTHFMNPHGLDHAQHFSTADDMARLTAYALKNSVFQQIVKTTVKKVPDPGQSWDRVWNNKNKMLSIYEGADGVKTGYTKLAKRCLVSSATRQGHQLAVVTLNDSNDWADHSRLLDWGFQNYDLVRLVAKGEEVENGLAAGATFQYALTEEEQRQITKVLEPADRASAAYRLGEAGKLKLLLDGKLIGTVPVYVAGDPRLAQAEKPAIRPDHKLSQSKQRVSGNGWLQTLASLFRSLFEGEG